MHDDGGGHEVVREQWTSAAEQFGTADEGYRDGDVSHQHHGVVASLGQDRHFVDPVNVSQ